MANFNKIQYCKSNHDTFVTGRTSQHRCKVCEYARNIAYRKANPEKVRIIARRYELAAKDKIADQKLRSKYGITFVQKQTMFATQSGKCATCSFLFISVTSAHVDHCHTIKKVRGLLCADCNLVAGKVKDNPARLRAIAAYLEAA